MAQLTLTFFSTLRVDPRSISITWRQPLDSHYFQFRGPVLVVINFHQHPSHPHDHLPTCDHPKSPDIGSRQGTRSRLYIPHCRDNRIRLDLFHRFLDLHRGIRSELKCAKPLLTSTWPVNG